MKYLKSFIHDPYRITPETMVDAEYADKVFEKTLVPQTNQDDEDKKKKEAQDAREEVKKLHKETEAIEVRRKRLASERDRLAGTRVDSHKITWGPLLSEDDDRLPPPSEQVGSRAWRRHGAGADSGQAETTLPKGLGPKGKKAAPVENPETRVRSPRPPHIPKTSPEWKKMAPKERERHTQRVKNFQAQWDKKYGKK